MNRPFVPDNGSPTGADLAKSATRQWGDRPAGSLKPGSVRVAYREWQATQPSANFVK